MDTKPDDAAEAKEKAAKEEKAAEEARAEEEKKKAEGEGEGEDGKKAAKVCVSPCVYRMG